MPEASFDASVVLHEITHFLDERLVTEWVNANLKELKRGRSPDELFVKGETVSFSEDLAQVENASSVAVDVGFLLIFLEGRGHNVGMQAQLLALDQEKNKSGGNPSPGVGASKQREAARQLLRSTLARNADSLLPLDPATVRAFQKQTAWQSLKGPITRKWKQEGIPAWKGRLSEENLFDVSEKWAGIMQETIARAVPSHS